jgi:hypothetical protein
MEHCLQAVVETPEYIKQAEKCMDEASRQSFINFIAAHPMHGDIISGTGGARKIRWTANSHQGKRGGARVIYYYHDQNMPIFLFTVYSKSSKDDLKMQEKKTLQQVIKQIVACYHKEKQVARLSWE